MVKVFGLGFSKTATTSLELALQILDYNVCKGHWNANYYYYMLALYIHRDYDELFKLINYWDAFADAPWGGSDLYRELYQRLPEAKYILTIRDSEAWYRSFEKFITMFDSNLETAFDSLYNHQMFGTAYYFRHVFGIQQLANQRQKIIEHYDSYNQKVIEFFTKNQADFLTIDITKENHWDTLCSFLKVESPELLPFPHMNKAMSNSEIQLVQLKFNRAFESQHKGELTLAETLYKELIELKILHPDIWNNLGMIKAKQGKIELAVKYLEAAYKISRNPEYKKNLEQIKRMNGVF